MPMLCDIIDEVVLHPSIKSGLVARSEVGNDVVCFPLQVGHGVAGFEAVEGGEEVSGGGGGVCAGGGCAFVGGGGGCGEC